MLHSSAGLDRRRGRIEIRAVEAQARLETQAVPRSQADHRDIAIRKQRTRHGLGMRRRQADLKSILAGVAGARDGAGHIHDLHRAHIHKAHRPHIWYQPRQSGLGGRSLQRQQRPIVETLDRAGGRYCLTQVGFVGVLAGGIGDHQKDLAEPRDHQIVADSPVLIGEQGVSLPTRSQAHDIHGHDQLQRTRGVLAAAGARPDFELSHMRHIEKPRGRADVKVLFQDAARVLNRHLVSRERHHTAAEIEMEPVERRAFEWHGRNHVAHDGTARTNDTGRATPKARMWQR